MSARNRILDKESALTNFFKSFFKAKADGKESDWLAALRKTDPKLGDIWTDYDKSITQSYKTQRDILKRRGLDTTDLDAYIKKYGLKI